MIFSSIIFLKKKHVDLKKVVVVLMGESAGANIAYQILMAMLDMAEKVHDSLVKVRGVILVQPNFSGEIRRKSEEQGSIKNGKGGYSIEVSNTLWMLVLPLGANRDHPFVNPLSNSCSWDMSLSKNVGILVVIAGDDIHGERVQEWTDGRVLINIFLEKNVGFRGGFLLNAKIGIFQWTDFLGWPSFDQHISGKECWIQRRIFIECRNS